MILICLDCSACNVSLFARLVRNAIDRPSKGLRCSCCVHAALSRIFEASCVRFACWFAVSGLCGTRSKTKGYSHRNQVHLITCDLLCTLEPKTEDKELRILSFHLASKSATHFLKSYPGSLTTHDKILSMFAWLAPNGMRDRRSGYLELRYVRSVSMRR